jgi:hypothetical protein
LSRPGVGPFTDPSARRSTRRDRVRRREPTEAGFGRSTALGKICVLLGAILVPCPGCDRGGGGALVIATSWPEAERDELEMGFRAWAATDPDAAGRPLRIVWIAPSPGQDPTVLVDRRVRVDLVLGGPASSYDRLAAEGLLDPVASGDRAAWGVARRSALGLASRRPAGEGGGMPPMSWEVLGEPEMADRVALDDPRGAPIALEWAKARLGSGSWARGYAELVRAAGNARPIGRVGGAALARLERGEDVLVPVSLGQEAHRSGVVTVRSDEAPGWVEGVGVVRGARDPGRARAFLRFLAGRAGAGPPPAPGNPPADALLSDLLGATLVDAQDELRTAWAALVRAGRPAGWEALMTVAPPWPPASVTTMQGAPETAPWVDTLAEQVAPHVDGRGWLMISWERPRRPIDGRFLDELAGVAGGRLAREPRFRAWLRGEWTAWARQRYRWIARQVGRRAP